MHGYIEMCDTDLIHNIFGVPFAQRLSWHLANLDHLLVPASEVPGWPNRIGQRRFREAVPDWKNPLQRGSG